MQDPLLIRSMTRSEVETLLQWAGEEGWNPGLHDAGAFWQIDPEAFLAITAADQLIGAGAIVRHNPHFGFMGLFLVQPAYRGQGIGSRLWHVRRDRLLARLESGGTIGMDAVEKMIPFYSRGGFHPVTRHRRYQYQPTPSLSVACPRIVELSSIPAADIQTFDQTCFPGQRSAYLKAWTSLPGSQALAVTEQSQLRGYAVMRPCLVGWKIGPLFAVDREDALELFNALIQRAGSAPVYLDVPENNPEAVALCEDRGMPMVFACVRMYHGPNPTIADERIFGVSTLELG